ncbi:hypothetical protein PR048_010060 [Dryococelus australis]|uniref:Integrase catalytic domain-containing protein n=1 Tax=Dryococelus australis TaxID=614101 RepID=A0ABQ9I1N3_9NEOP|nr:hypothetical protein PR048_010060 [Dryococelus australis]
MDGNEMIFMAFSGGSDVYLVSCQAYKTTGKIVKCDSVKSNLPTGMTTMKSAVTWHRRMGHLTSFPAVCDISSSYRDCGTCLKGETKKAGFTDSASRTSAVLVLVHSDIVGRITPLSIGGAEYFVVFMDGYSGWNFYKKKIKALQSDNRGEYIGKEFEKHLRDKGILHRKIVPYSPQQNGKAERLNQTLLNMTRSMLFEAVLPKRFWAEVLSTANEQFTFQLWYDKDFTVDDINHIYIFGCQVWAATLENWKLSSKADECLFLGFQEGIKGYRLCRLSDKRILVSRDMCFYEHTFPFKTPCPAKP